MGTLSRLALDYNTSRVRRRELQPDTARDHWSTLTTFLRVAGARPVIGEATIERWLEDRAHVQPATLATQWSVVAGFLDWLVKHPDHPQRRNPMRDMRPPRRPRVQPITLNDGDHQRILAVLPDARARAIIALEHGMGARRVEVSRLRVEDWYRREGMMLLTGKGGAQRFVPVPTDARAALDAYLAEHPATSGPFIRSYKRPHQPLSPGAIGHLVTQWMLEAGAKLAPWDGKSGHSLRRTAATEVLEVTGDIRAAQELLGHASLSSTAHYIRRVDLAGLRDALEARGSLGEGHRLREAA